MNYQSLSLIAFSVFFVSLSVGGQNLVPNPSFEDTVSCPSTLADLSSITFWTAPTQGSPDYFNSCSSNSDIDVPLNGFGNQIALSGNAYVGIGVYDTQSVFSYREYIQVQLEQALSPGQEYFVEFHVSLSDFNDYGIQELGAYFSMFEINDNSMDTTLSFIPQIEFSDSVITDQTNWTKVSGSFIATGYESHLLIGNFNRKQTTTASQVSNNDIDYAYYYIDDVCISTDSTLCANYDYNGIKNEALINTFQIYPNPADQLLTIKNPKGVAYTYTLYNLNGSILFEQLQAQHSVKEVDLSSLAAGIYVLSIQSAGLIYNHKIAVR
jgi:hypothetical protein